MEYWSYFFTLLFRTGIEFCKLFLVLHGLLRLKLRSRLYVAMYVVLAFGCMFGISFFGKQTVEVPLHMFLCLLLAMFVFEGTYHILYTLVSYIGISMFDMLVAILWRLFLGVSYYELAVDDTFDIPINAVGIFVLFVLCMISRKCTNWEIDSSQKGNRAFLWLLLIGELSLFLFITAFQLCSDNEQILDKIMIVGLSVGSMVFLLVGIVMIVNHLSKNHYKEISEMNKRLLQSQEQYYAMLLEKNEETKKFRHDIKNHMNCMYMLLQEKEYTELENYLERFAGEVEMLQMHAQTGNKIVNAILGDMYAKYPAVTCNIQGHFPPDITICQMDMCTLFYNLFENAFFAAQQSEKKEVHIGIRQFQGHFLVRVENTIARVVTIVNGNIQTTKKQKELHGYGTINAKQCAKKNGGTLEFTCTQHSFVAELFLPDIQEE